MTPQRDDGFHEYTLGKAYGEHQAGEVLRVDSERRFWLDQNGYGRTEEIAPLPKHRRAELSTPKILPEIPTPPLPSDPSDPPVED